MSKIIEVTVSPTGETTIQTKGFTGEECRQSSRNLELALGIKISEKLTNEFYAESKNTEEARQ